MAAVYLVILYIDGSRLCAIIQLRWKRWPFIAAAPIPYKQNGGIIMAISKAQQRAVAKYNAANYDRIELRVEKGKKEEIKAHADKTGEKLNKFINRAISETMERDERKREVGGDC